MPSNYRWQDAVRSMLNELIKEYEIPEGSLYMKDSYSKTNGKLNSHIIYIWEPDYPPLPNAKPDEGNQVVSIFPSRAMSRPEDLDLNMQERQLTRLQKHIPDDAILMNQTQDEKKLGMVRVRFNKYSPTLVGFIKVITKYNLDHYSSHADTFGCCSMFIECSDAKKCVHSNKLYSKACRYRDHLDNGRIFYGKNKNV